jgi:hypothetical protein
MENCKICSQELKVELEPEDFDEATSSAVGGEVSSAPDDLLLTCGCHFHWYVNFSFFDGLSFVSSLRCVRVFVWSFTSRMGYCLGP